MMDRINFLKSIDQKDKEYVSTIVTFFDQLMLLYSLVGSYDNIKISNETNDSVVSFNVNLKDEDNVNQLLRVIYNNKNRLIIYDKIYSVFSEPISNTSIKIIIS